MNATDGTDATTDEAIAINDRPFDTPSFIINSKLLGVFLNIAMIVIFVCSLLYS